MPPLYWQPLKTVSSNSPKASTPHFHRLMHYSQLQQLLEYDPQLKEIVDLLIQPPFNYKKASTL
jgi:hypothetical protein